MTSPSTALPTTQAGRFRPELHGLRGLAIGLVVLYHIWFDRVSGGVDVFLFISAFLLVGTFLRRADRGAPM
ncbi:MAG: acyltransferase, partial [Brachybacterium sp.]|nr:acyltransferase [Brachybacterium sp.]